MTLKEQLVEASLGRGDFVIGAANAFKLLDLLKAAKDMVLCCRSCGGNGTHYGFGSHEPSIVRCESCRPHHDAINAIDEPPERVAGRPERMPPGVENPT